MSRFLTLFLLLGLAVWLLNKQDCLLLLSAVFLTLVFGEVGLGLLSGSRAVVGSYRLDERYFGDGHFTPGVRDVMDMPFGDIAGARHYDTPRDVAGALVVHGEHDERVPLQAVFDWARPASHPVVVVPGADHFFSGRLPVLRTLVLSHLKG